jgi:hypothetical protein
VALQVDSTLTAAHTEYGWSSVSSTHNFELIMLFDHSDSDT